MMIRGALLLTVDLLEMRSLHVVQCCTDYMKFCTKRERVPSHQSVHIDQSYFPTLVLPELASSPCASCGFHSQSCTSQVWKFSSCHLPRQHCFLESAF